MLLWEIKAAVAAVLLPIKVVVAVVTKVVAVVVTKVVAVAVAVAVVNLLHLLHTKRPLTLLYKCMKQSLAGHPMRAV
jgi:phosphopantothenate synthetase